MNIRTLLQNIKVKIVRTKKRNRKFIITMGDFNASISTEGKSRKK